MTKSRAFAELLIDCEEDRTLRAVLVGMWVESDPSGEFHIGEPNPTTVPVDINDDPTIMSPMLWCTEDASPLLAV